MRDHAHRLPYAQRRARMPAPPRVRRGPPPPLAVTHALFLDIDGTLVDIAPTPDRVRLHPGLASLLPAVATLLDGAVALVTGRSIRDTDRLFGELVLPVAGQHGCERRDGTGTLHLHAANTATLARLRRLIAEFAARHEGLRLEDKGTTLALHYRAAPHLASHVHQVLRAQFNAAPMEGFRLQPGKRLLEVRPEGRDKGTAIRDFMSEPPFHGRVPVFIGDDRTDEHGFAVVRSLGGLAIKVGPGSTIANHRLHDVAAVRRWLDDAVAIG
ncbi:MAG TPA: trehalose-phosphatase [Casimicrobiaceae bacterium]|jgi:trehalose 6-phosphate phosphatase|nr:trehalose-phosphatase [Casimicrobiaceae bacterium]